MRSQLVKREDQMNAWSSMRHETHTAVAALASLDRDDLAATMSVLIHLKSFPTYRGIATEFVA